SRAARAPRMPVEGQARGLRRSAASGGGGPRRTARRLFAGSVVFQAVAMQIGTMGVQPRLGTLHFWAYSAQHAPEPPRVVHFDEMGDLVCGEIVEHVARRQHEAPRE